MYYGKQTLVNLVSEDVTVGIKLFLTESIIYLFNFSVCLSDTSKSKIRYRFSVRGTLKSFYKDREELDKRFFEKLPRTLKLVSAIFYQIFIFSPNDNP